MGVKEKNLKLLLFFSYFISLVPKAFVKIVFLRNECNIYLNKKYLKSFSFFLKNHNNLMFSSIIDLTCVDYPKRNLRFEIIYFFLSFFFSYRINLKFAISEFESLESLNFLYKGINWLEREVWDLFGIFFTGHPDLRRILNDYGFEGFPLRKDFPLTGFVEVRYDDEKKCIIYEDLSLAQEYRFFSFSNPWEFFLNKKL